MVNPASLRIVFLGTPAFAVPTLDALLTSRHRVVAVLTRPDRPRGRGQKTIDAPVKARAAAAGIPVLQPDRLRDPAFANSLAALQADLGVVAAYGAILPESVISAPRLGTINVHASLLPRYRGAAPVHRAIIAGERETGVTIMRVVKRLDAGPMLASVTRPIGPEETSVEVERDLARLGAPLLVEIADRLAGGHVAETPQDEDAATYAPRLTKEDGSIDWSCPAARIHDLVRGLHPWPHAFSVLGGRRYILIASAVDRVTTSPGLPGTIVETEGDRLVVATGDGALRLLQIQPEGKRSMSVREFLAGHRIARGARFSR
jgi:methionyl-tRNA formyltransferase